MTVAHTAGVFAIGIVTLALSRFVVPSGLYPWLTLVSGLLVVAVGAAVLRQRLRRAGAATTATTITATSTIATTTGDHDHDHEHDALTSKGILGVGVAAGLLPCPSALVVLLSGDRAPPGRARARAHRRVQRGPGRHDHRDRPRRGARAAAFGRLSLDGPVARALPAVSAALILGVGIVITARAVPGVV